MQCASAVPSRMLSCMGVMQQCCAGRGPQAAWGSCSRCCAGRVPESAWGSWGSSICYHSELMTSNMHCRMCQQINSAGYKRCPLGVCPAPHSQHPSPIRPSLKLFPAPRPLRSRLPCPCAPMPVPPPSPSFPWSPSFQPDSLHPTW